MKRLLLLFILLSSSFWSIDRLSAADTSFRIVMRDGSTAETLKRAEVSAIFLKKSVKLADGTFVVPVDLPVSSQARQAFSQVVHGRTAEAIDAFWSRQLFSGRGVPPAIIKTTAEVLTHVLAHEEAIAYVDGEIELPAGIRVLALSD